jgi:hypothetical protein
VINPESLYNSGFIDNNPSRSSIPTISMNRLKRTISGLSGYSGTSEASRASGRSESSVSTLTTQCTNGADLWSGAMLARLKTCRDELERALSNTFFTNREAWSQSCGISLDQLTDDLEVLKSRSRQTFDLKPTSDRRSIYAVSLSERAEPLQPRRLDFFVLQPSKPSQIGSKFVLRPRCRLVDMEYGDSID